MSKTFDRHPYAAARSRLSPHPLRAGREGTWNQVVSIARAGEVIVVDVAVSFGSVFISELGDKTQLLVVSLAASVKPSRLFAEIVAALVVLQTVSVTIGAAIAAALAAAAGGVIAGALFVGCGAWMAWTSRERGTSDDAPHGIDVARNGSALVVGAMFIAAEVGDKTMFTTAALAADRGVVQVWLGSFAAMVAALGLAVVAGRSISERVRPASVQRRAAGVFIALGVVTLVDVTMS